jgi:hypothetical protein
MRKAQSKVTKILKNFKTSPILSFLIFIVIAVIILVSYSLREFLHIRVVTEHPTIIENIRIDKEGDYTWKVPNGTWNSRKGEGRISLLFKMIPEFRGKELMDRSKRSLELRIEVYALRKDGTRIDRLIRNRYFTTDEPFSEAGSRIWGSFGGEEFEYGLAGIWAYPKEDVFIHLRVIHPDTELAVGNPRLKISGNYDYATAPFIILFIMVDFGLLALLLVILLILTFILLMKKEILSEA